MKGTGRFLLRKNWDSRQHAIQAIPQQKIHMCFIVFPLFGGLDQNRY